MKTRLDALLTEDVNGRVSRFIWLRQFEVGKTSTDAIVETHDRIVGDIWRDATRTGYQGGNDCRTADFCSKHRQEKQRRSFEAHNIPLRSKSTPIRR